MTDIIVKIIAAPIDFVCRLFGWRRMPRAEAVIISVFALVLGAYVYAVVEQSKVRRAEEARFMAECEADRKRYECVAMWRGVKASGNRDASDMATGVAIGTAVGMGMSSGRR